MGCAVQCRARRRKARAPPETLLQTCLCPYAGRMTDLAHAAILDLLDTPDPADLGPHRREGTMTESAVRAAVSGIELRTDRQELVLALVLLWHDHLETSHTISQGIGNADGSFVHAMMHRREPDYWNSKYWWRRVGNHAAFAELGRRAGERLKQEKQANLLTALAPDGAWQPTAFVDACERVAGRPTNEPEVTALRELQQIEFKVMLQRFLNESGNAAGAP